MSQTLQQLIYDFSRLPGIGERTAERLVFHLLRHGRTLMNDLAEDLSKALREVRLCSSCQNFTESDPCTLCHDGRRRDDLLCVVEEPHSIPAIEKTHAFRGRYHILHGHLSPLDGVGPEELRIPELLKRIQPGGVQEIILATNTNVGGDATALYLANLLHPLGVKVTRLSSGVPAGADLTYLDQVTLARALEHRVAI